VGHGLVTSLRKSDAQLDAEASAPLEERDLDAAIAAHRVLYAADLGILRLHVRDGESGIGPPFAPPFANFLDYWYCDAKEPCGHDHTNDLPIARYGIQFPWTSGLKAVRIECRRSHKEHWDRPEWRGSFCYQLVSMVCCRNWTYERACFELAASPRRTRGPMFRALRRIEDEMQKMHDKEMARQSPAPRTPAEWMAEEHHHRVLDGLHVEDCIQCLRRRAAA
jgi:hypothetical protein